jgi:hypothetical protein
MEIPDPAEVVATTIIQPLKRNGVVVDPMIGALPDIAGPVSKATSLPLTRLNSPI